ncbi:MAG: Uma2 family endonuclease [Acidimicrobiia bacterium]
MSVVDSELLARAQHAVDELVPEGVRVEILDGLVVVNPPASLAHGELTSRIAALLDATAPEDLAVNATGIGVYRSDDARSEYQVPDVVAYRRPTDAARLVGHDVELVAEVVSPANRRQLDYEAAVVSRATDYGIKWVLIVDPDTRLARWWHDGAETVTEPHWAAHIGTDASWPR